MELKLRVTRVTAVLAGTGVAAATPGHRVRM